MEVTLKRLTKNGAFANEVLFLTQQKSYSFGRMSENDVVLIAPKVAKHHCVFHHNSNGLFVEVLKSLAGVVINGIKNSTGSLVRLHNKDVIDIGLLFKYQVEMKPIVQDFDTETNFTSDFDTDYESIKEEDLSDTNINTESELEDATSGIENIDYEENRRSTRRVETFNSEASTPIKEELTLEEETQGISTHEIDSSMQITIDEDFKPLIPLNSQEEALTDPNTIDKISQESETLKLSEFSNFVREDTLLRKSYRINKKILQKSCDESFKNRVSEKPEQNNISLTENEISNDQVSENQTEISKEQSNIFEEKNIVFSEESQIIPEKISDGMSCEQNISKSPKEVSKQLNISQSPKEVSKQLNISNKENSIYSEKDVEQFVSKFNKNSFQPFINLERYTKAKKTTEQNTTKSSSGNRPVRKNNSKKTKRFTKEKGVYQQSIEKWVRNPFAQKVNSTNSIVKKKDQLKELKIVLERLPIGNSANAMEILKTHSVKKLSSESVKKLPSESSTPEKKLETEPVKKLKTNFIPGLDSVKNLQSELSSSETKLEINELPSSKKRESSKRKITKEIKTKSTKKLKSCQEKENTDLPEKHLSVTIKDILKNPISDSPSTRKLATDSENPKPTKRRRINRKKTGPPIKCPKCLKIYPPYFNLKRHLMTHEEKSFSCVYCDKKISSKHYLDIHQKMHTSERPYNCENCGKGFVANWQLQDHLEIHIKERAFSCDICKRTFKTKSDVRDHLKIHSEGRRQTCGICLKILANKASLESHMLVHTSQGKINCKKCSKVFHRAQDLRNHMKYHANAKEFKCLQCDKSYNLRSVLNSHVRKSHTRTGLHECNVCDKMFLGRTKFEEHQRIHTGERPFTCDVCKKTFRGKTDMRNHVVMHLPKLTCNECPETFPNKFDLRRHLKTHFPKKRNICPECGYVTPKSSLFVEHLRVHTGERPFKCEVCKKTFAIKSTLRSHMMLHTGNYPYRCKKCDKGFNKPHLLKSHINSHAKRKPFICAVCCFPFRYKTSCRVHYLKHKSNVRKCETCHLEFRARPTFQKHCRKHLKIEGEFNCTICTKKFKLQKDLIAHCQKTLDSWGKCPKK